MALTLIANCISLPDGIETIATATELDLTSLLRVLKKELSPKPYKKKPYDLRGIAEEEYRVVLERFSHISKKITGVIAKDDVEALLAMADEIEALDTYLRLKNSYKMEMAVSKAISKEDKASIAVLKDERLSITEAYGTPQELHNLQLELRLSKKSNSISKDQYRELAKLAHPDKGGSDEAMQILTGLYEKTLGKKELRMQELQAEQDREHNANKAKRYKIDAEIASIEAPYIASVEAELNDAKTVLGIGVNND